MTTSTHDTVVIGGGVNGLVAAAYLAKAGRRVLVLERGSPDTRLPVTEAAPPGFQLDPLGQDAGWVPAEIVRDLGLAKEGLELFLPEASVFTPLEDGRSLVLWTDAARTAEEIARLSPEDGPRWGAFTTRVARFAGFLEALYRVTPPDLPAPAGADLLTLFGLGRRLRGLGKAEMIELLRVLPMSAAEWLNDTFTHEGLKGTVGAAGITRIQQGPRSGGTAFVLLHHHVGRPAGAIRASHQVRGGAGKLRAAVTAAAQRLGVEIRTGAAVRQVLVQTGAAGGVVLETGEEIRASRVLSSADPRRTMLGLVDAAYLEPEFIRAIQNIKFRGVTACVGLALGELPNFAARPGDGPHLRGAISISPSLDYLERAYDAAKYGEVSERPYLEARIPSLHDPSIAPPGRHVMTVQVQYAPYHRKDTAWDHSARERLADLVVNTLGAYAPNLKAAVLHRHVVTPRDLEDHYGLTEGHLYHGELTLDQVFFMRPVAGWARYRTPIRGLYLCGAGTHPGGGLAGACGRNAAREVLKEGTA